MSRSISRSYFQVCATKYKPLGFIKGKSSLIRIRGDILQVFTLKTSKTPVGCNVDFGIFPLCLPLPICLEEGGYLLSCFDVEPLGLACGWSYIPYSDEDILNCVQSISSSIDSHLIPFFDMCNNCESALHHLAELEHLFDCNRQKTLEICGTADCAIPYEERSLFDYRKYYMALKAHDFAYAEKYLNHQISFYSNRLMLINAPGVQNQPPIVKERHIAKIKLWSEHLERLHFGDDQYFSDILAFNETNMRQFLATKYPHIQFDI